MRVRLGWLCIAVAGLATPPLVAQTPALSNVESPYPAVQSTVRIAGGTYGPGAVSYGPAGTPLVLSGSDFGASGTVVFKAYNNGAVVSTVQASVTSWSETILFLTVPSGAGPGLVYVNADGKTSNGLPFIVTPGAYAGSCPSSPPTSEIQITTSSLPDGTVGQGYSATLNATGGTPPYTWSLTGNALPAGLSLSASSGAITGTPTTAGGPVSLTVKAVDSHSQATDAVLDISIESQTLTPATVYSYSVPASGGFDPNGNVRQYNDSIMGTWNFNYDNLNRLSSAIPGTGAPGGYTGQNLCMNYDPWGNRTQSDFQSTACNPTTDPATANYSTANKVTWTTVNTAVNGFIYDAAGNVLYDGLNYYSYDGEGRLCAMQTYPYNGGVEAYGYVYDAEGRRVAKGTITPSPVGQSPSCNLATNGFTLTESYVLGQSGDQLTTTSWNGSNSTWARTNVYGEGKLLATYDTGGLHFHLTDSLGTRRLQASASGVPELDCQSLPFGDQMNCFPDPDAEDGGEDATPLHYTGKQRDTESGNEYFGARYYASSIGRFISPDWSAQVEPIPYAKLDDPQSLNLYSYVGNNPLTGRDPDGHFGPGQDCPSFLTCPPSIPASSGNDDPNQNPEAQQQNGDPTLPTSVQPPPPSLADKVESALMPKTPLDAALLVVPGDLGEVGEATEALSKAAKIEKLTGEAKELYPKLAEKADQLHHVIPKYLGGAQDGELAKIPAAYHQLITNAFRTLAPYGQAVSRTAEEVTNIVKQVYSMYPLP